MRRMLAPARARMAWTASPACADASHAGAGPGRASPGGTSPLGITHHLKDYGRRPRTAEVEEAFMARRGIHPGRHGVPGSAVGKDSDEALHRVIQICRSQGIQPSNGVEDEQQRKLKLLTSC